MTLSNKIKKSYKGGAAAAAVTTAAADTAPETSVRQHPQHLMQWPNIQFFTLIGPYILIGFFILLSIFNSNIKGIIYVIGLIITLFISNIISAFIPPSPSDDNKFNPDAICKAFGFSKLLNQSLPLGILVYSYTFIYLFIPMIQHNMINFSLIITLLLIITTDIIIQIHN